jgi:hypothetical protein
MLDLSNIVEELVRERDRLNAAIAALEDGRPARRYRQGAVSTKDSPKVKGRRSMSASVRKRLSTQMKARWAKAKKAGKQSL